MLNSFRKWSVHPLLAAIPVSPWSLEKPMESFGASGEVVKVWFDSWATARGGTTEFRWCRLSGMNSEYCSIVTLAQSDRVHRWARYSFCSVLLLCLTIFALLFSFFLTFANGLIFFFCPHTLQFHLCILSLFILFQIPLLLFSSSKALTMLQYSENASAFPCAHEY